MKKFLKSVAAIIVAHSILLIAGTLFTIAVNYLSQYVPYLKNISNITITIYVIVIFLLVSLIIRIFSFGKKQYSLLSRSGLFYFSENTTIEDKTQNKELLLSKIRDSRGIEICGATGYNTFAKENAENKAMLRDAFENATGEIKILLLDPYAPQTEMRATLLGVPLDTYQQEIFKSVDFLKFLKDKGKNVALKFYSQRPIWKMIIAGDFLWLQHYQTTFHVETSPVYGIHNKGGNDYNLFTPFYAAFQKKWSYDNYPTYDFETDEIVFPQNPKPTRIKREDWAKWYKQSPILHSLVIQ